MGITVLSAFLGQHGIIFKHSLQYKEQGILTCFQKSINLKIGMGQKVLHTYRQTERPEQSFGCLVRSTIHHSSADRPV